MASPFCCPLVAGQHLVVLPSRGLQYRSRLGISLSADSCEEVSKKHQHVGESSAEDEYMALDHDGKMVVWLRNLFKEMGLGELVSKPTSFGMA